jgi:uncharacterized membrane protein
MGFSRMRSAIAAAKTALFRGDRNTMLKTVVPTGGAGPVTVPVGDGVAVVVVVTNTVVVVDDWAGTSAVVEGIVVVAVDSCCSEEVLAVVVMSADVATVVLLALDSSDPQSTSATKVNIAMARMVTVATC